MTRKILVSLLAIVLFTGFVSLGSWQLERREWKLDLISRVESQLQKLPVPAPGRDQWKRIGPEDAYLPVTISGTYQHSQETLVQAMTALGSGYWLLTPLRRPDDTIVLINRGFVDSAHRAPASRPDTQHEGRVTVQGLLRLAEPNGRFFMPNDPAEKRWYSRDVEAIGQELELTTGNLAPYFIDANFIEANVTAANTAWPVGGLTVVKFRNSHLLYAIIWYTLALMTAVGAWILLRDHKSTESFNGDANS